MEEIKNSLIGTICRNVDRKSGAGFVNTAPVSYCSNCADFDRTH